MHHGTVACDNEVGRPPLHLLEYRQTAAAGTGRAPENADVAGPVTDKGKIAGRHVRDDDLTGFTGRNGLSVGAQRLDDDVLGTDVQTAVRALVGNETGIAGAVAVGHRTTKDLADQPSLLIVELLGGDERNPDPETAHVPPLPLRVARDQGEARWIAKQHCRAAGDDGRHESIEICLRHLEGRQERAAQQGVAQAANPILGTEFDRAAPDDQFAVANVNPPPARGAPLGGDVVALALLAHEEDQRLARRATGVVARQRAVARRLQTLQIRPDLGLAEQGQRLQGVG
ncbi:MAG: hypothetical protein AW07_00137 [Candidatus Accumulibacter sp. SK-11]|nr:MAG: hypothetical protein AW07_00137 [Candidatus Accumulibacter sp. SK-11]